VVPEQLLFDVHSTHWPVELHSGVRVGQFEADVHSTQPRLALHTRPLGQVFPLPHVAPPPPPFPPVLLLLPPHPAADIQAPTRRQASAEKMKLFVRFIPA
jgi:hypothetical protein